MHCCICQDEEGGDDDAARASHTLECGHAFHTSCILSWFRRGGEACPLCRDVPWTIRPMLVEERYSWMRAHARRKTAPAALRRLVEDVRLLEAKVRSTRVAVRAHRRQHRAVYQHGELLSRRLRTQHVALEKCRHRIGMFQYAGAPLPPLSARAPMLDAVDDLDDLEEGEAIVEVS